MRSVLTRLAGIRGTGTPHLFPGRVRTQLTFSEGVRAIVPILGHGGAREGENISLFEHWGIFLIFPIIPRLCSQKERGTPYYKESST